MNSTDKVEETKQATLQIGNYNGAADQAVEIDNDEVGLELGEHYLDIENMPIWTEESISIDIGVNIEEQLDLLESKENIGPCQSDGEDGSDSPNHGPYVSIVFKEKNKVVRVMY